MMACMRSRTPPDLIGHCKRCILRQAICICAEIPTVKTRAQVLIVRHATEARLTSNSGRLAHLALPNSMLLSHGDWGLAISGDHAGQIRSSRVDGAALRGEGAVLLYGSGRAPTATPLVFQPRRLIVLDGSYRQARRMYKRFEALRNMPELSLSGPIRTVERLRKAPAAGGMATLEAIAHALDLLEGEEAGAPLHTLYAEFVRRTRLQRGYPERSSGG